MIDPYLYCAHVREYNKFKTIKEAYKLTTDLLTKNLKPKEVVIMYDFSNMTLNEVTYFVKVMKYCAYFRSFKHIKFTSV